MGTPSLDLGSLTSVAEQEEEGHWVEIDHPSGGPLCMGKQDQPLRIKVVGSYSKTYRTNAKRQHQELLQKRGKFSESDKERRDLDTLVVCTKAWEHAYDDKGKAIPFNADNVRILYAQAPFIFDQVDSAIVDHAAFFPSSSPTP